MIKKIDLLTHPHKEQRKWLYTLSIEASDMDFNNESQLEQFKINFQNLIDNLKEHAENEELFILPLIVDKFPKEADVFQQEHPEIEVKIQALHEAMKELDQSNNRADLGLTFYRLLNRFIAEYLLHLDAEEQKILPVLEEHFSAEELLGVMITFKTFREGSKPDQVKQFITPMLHALNLTSLINVFESVKRYAPANLFAHVCILGSDIIDPELWQKVQKQIGE